MRNILDIVSGKHRMNMEKLAELENHSVQNRQKLQEMVGKLNNYLNDY